MKNKEIPQSKLKPVKEEKKKGKKKVGRPTILTPELRSKLIKLFEEHFFLWIVSAKAGIYKSRIIDWKREQEPFRDEVTYAQGLWIAHQMELLDKYAKDKREKDWRALKYKLSIADKEFNDKKYLRDEVGKRDSTQITIILDRRDLETSKIEASKVIGESKLEEERISLIPFKNEKRKKPANSEKKADTGEAETL